jgi:hypothetical protein
MPMTEFYKQQEIEKQRSKETQRIIIQYCGELKEFKKQFGDNQATIDQFFLAKIAGLEQAVGAICESISNLADRVDSLENRGNA